MMPSYHTGNSQSHPLPLSLSLTQEDDKHALVQHHLQKLRGKLNFKNLRMYVESYMG